MAALHMYYAIITDIKKELFITVMIYNNLSKKASLDNSWKAQVIV